MNLASSAASQQESLDWTGGQLRIAGATDVGLVRRVNQDAFGCFCDAERDEVLCVVADGLGGHRGGEVASKMAIETIAEHISVGEDEACDRLTAAIELANQKILGAARKDRTLDGMGTTIVCLLLARGRRSFVAHVGDSRLYRLRGETFEAVTEDHSLVATLLREGVLSEEEAKDDPRRNQILRALGVREDLEIEVSELVPAAGDRYLLCSDGLHGLIDENETRRLLAVDRAPIESAASLIEAANRAGGNDNITCLIANLPATSIFSAFPSIQAGTARLSALTRSLFRNNDDE